MRTKLTIGLLAIFACNIDVNIQKDFDGEGPEVIALQSGLVVLDLSAQPTPGVSTTDVVSVFFSEPLDPSTVFEDTAFLVEGEVDLNFVSDANSPPLLASRKAQIQPVELTLEASAGEENNAIFLAPKEPLEEQTLYTLVVSSAIRDANGSPLIDDLGVSNAFTFTFITGNTEDGSPIASLVFPAPSQGQQEAQNVPTNLPRAIIRFSKPVLGVIENGNDQGRILLLDNNKLPVSVDVEDGVILGLAGCGGSALSQCFAVNIDGELAANASHQIILEDGITDLVGQTLVGDKQFRFSTGAGPDDIAPSFLAGPDVAPQDVSATVTFVVDEASSGTVAFGEGALTDEVSTAVTDLGGGQFRHQATLEPLTAETNFNFEAQVTDFAGNTISQSGSFTTSPQLPQLAISEVLANAQGSSETAEEFVEVVNLDAVSIDLDGLILQRLQGGASVSNLTIVSLNGGSTILSPGQFAVIGGSNFNPTSFSVAAGALLVTVTSSTGTPSNLSLSNSTDQGYAIQEDGFSLDVFTNFLPHDCNGRSVERNNFDLGDVDGNTAYSQDPTGATPGRANSDSDDQQGNVCF